MVASERARFADTHLRVGVYPGPCSSTCRAGSGPAWARRDVAHGQLRRRRTALRIGLVNHVVAHDDLVPFTLDLAAAIAEQPRDMVAAMREDWDRTDRLPVADAHAAHGVRRATRASRLDGGDLASHRTDVIARAHRQLGG